MKLRTAQVEDLEEQRELYEQFMPGDLWIGDEHGHTFWATKDGDHTVAMCSAVYRPQKGYVYFSSAGVDPRYRGLGLQRKLIQTRLRWARRQGAIYVVTYARTSNYPSVMNLLKCGFRFNKEPRGWAGVEDSAYYFYFEREL